MRVLMLSLAVVVWLLLPYTLRPARVAPEAQEIQTCTPEKTLINTNSGGTDIPVGAALTDVLPVNAFACTRTLWNRGGAPIRCMSKPQGQPSATKGILLNSGEQILLGTQGREAWWCIRSTGVDSFVVTIEGLP